MDFIKFFPAAISRYFLGFIIILALLVRPAHSLDSLDSQIFINGFNAYQKKDYKTAIEKMSQVLKQFPDTPLRDMAIFWLARANYRAGDQKEAAKYMAQFFKEYPDSPLKVTVEEDLARNAARYERGEFSPETVGTQLAEKAASDKLAAEKSATGKAEADRLSRENAEALRLAEEKGCN